MHVSDGVHVEVEDSLQELVLPSAERAPRMELKPLGGQQAPFLYPWSRLTSWQNLHFFNMGIVFQCTSLFFKI